MTSTLTIPAQKRRRWSARPRPQRIARDLARLPASSGAAADALGARLAELNRTAASAQRRERCLALFESPARGLYLTLLEHLAAESAPLSAVAQARVERLGDLYAQLAVGHLLSLRDQSRPRPETGAAALRALARMLLLHYHGYMTVPTGAWEAVHRCHPPAGNDDERETLYKQILILGGTGAYRFRSLQQLAVHRALADWARQARLDKAGRQRTRGTTLVFRPGDDRPPILYPGEDCPRTPEWRVIDTTPLASLVRQQLDAAADPDRSPAVGLRLESDSLRALITTWSDNPQRRFPRVRAERSLQAHAGFSNIAATLDGGPGLPALPARVLNESANGFNLGLDDPEPGSVAIGELILGERAHFEGRVLGVVRWLYRDGDRHWTAGVETMARETRSVALYRADGTGTGLPALALPANAAAQTPAAVITPEPLAQRDADWLLTGKGSNTRIRIGRQLEETDSFCLYRYSATA